MKSTLLAFLPLLCIGCKDNNLPPLNFNGIEKIDKIQYVQMFPGKAKCELVIKDSNAIKAILDDINNAPANAAIIAPKEIFTFYNKRGDTVFTLVRGDKYGRCKSRIKQLNGVFEIGYIHIANIELCK